MEEYSDLEHVTGSPTAGESGFVHVESINSASMDGSAINQDDGVVVTRVDTVQDESNDLTMTDDGGNEEFVDCPDDLLSYDGWTDFDENQETEVLSEDNQQTLFHNDREILPHHYQEERQQLMTELTNLRHQLKDLIKKHPLIDGNNGVLFTYEHAETKVEGDDKSLWPLHEMIFDCSRFIELALSQQSQTDQKVKQLYTTLDTKDKEIMALNVKVTEHNHLLSEVEMLRHFSTELKRKELELTHKSSHLENECMKLMQQVYKSKETIKMLDSEIGKLKDEVEVEKSKYSNTREKLNLAVSKGKSLVQQRESLKQAVVEKTSELDKCLLELQEKLKTIEEMVKIETLANSLKDESFKLKDEIKRMKEDGSVKIDKLTVSLLMESQEKNYLEHLTRKVSEEICVMKEKNVSMKIDLQRSEDKVGLLREKLSMAVKKGKSLVQEREIMKKQIVEKNANFETLKLELKQKEDWISKMKTDFVNLKEERDEIKKYLGESNSLLQKVIDASNEIVLSNDINDPVEKVKLCAKYLNECQVSKQELTAVKDETLKTVKLLEDALLVSEKNVSKLTEENTKLENMKSHIEDELNNANRTIKSLEDTVSQLQTHVYKFSHENETSQNDRNLLESEIKKLKDESSYHEHKFMNASETIQRLEDELLKVNNTVSNLLEEKKNVEQEISTIKQDDWTFELLNFLGNLQMLLKDGTLLILFKESIEKKLEVFKEMDNHLKDINNYFYSQQVQDYPAIQESFHFENVVNIETINRNEEDAEKNIKTYAGKTLEKLNLRNKILTDEFIRFSEFIDELNTSLLIKLEAIKNRMPITLEQTKSLQKNIDDLKVDKQVHEKKASVMSIELKELQAELEKNRSMFEKVKQENDMLQNRVSKMETELKESQSTRDEMVIKLQDYQAKEDEWNKRREEVNSFVKDHESEISEVEDQVPIAKRNRTLRRESNDHFALNIEPESDHLIDKQETIQDKGHVFKSLNTSCLVPPQGKIIADRLDGMWVSGGGVLMSRPRARLGVMAYWVVLHLWLVATLL